MAKVTSLNIVEFQEKLLEWFCANGRTFPWRRKGLSSYELVIAETLLQRTKAENVSPFYKKFLSIYPDWSSLNTVPEEKLAEHLVPLGLYRQRATRLKKLAFEMARRRGKFPSNRDELDAIPFIGQYIGNAIELLVFKRPLPLVDVNMSRVLERYFRKRTLSDIRYDPFLQGLAKRVAAHKQSIEINWAILDYAAQICTAKDPKCDNCILASKCTYYRNH